MSQEAFIKAQLLAFCKALNKYEAPMKQKHVRALIVGTHKLRSARVFWHAAARVQFEKNPVITWKFCQLLHKLMHDGHRKVPEDSFEYCYRITQVGSFWQHLRTSGYGMANTGYCKMLVNRLKFHKKYPSIPGSLLLSASQMEALVFDINECFELAIDVLDQFDDLLNLKEAATSIMESMRWSSLVPQGQCLIAPLILVILDTSKFYDLLVKALFRLHSNVSSDLLVGHRERFYLVFKKTKKFYEEASALQYFKYLVSIPTLPSSSPNFQQISELESYQPPQAYLHASASSEGGETPPDSQSVCDESIIDLSSDESLSLVNVNLAASPSQTSSNVDSKDAIINDLRQELDSEREMKEQVLKEAHSRIDQYENRLVQMKSEIDSYKQTSEERLQQVNLLQSSNNSEQEEIARKIQDGDYQLQKMKVLYQQLRDEHIKSLTVLKELRTKLDEKEEEVKQKSTEFQNLSDNAQALSHEKRQLEQNALSVKQKAENDDALLREYQEKVCVLEAQIRELTLELKLLKEESIDKVTKLNEQRIADLLAQRSSVFESVFLCATSILEQSLEDMQNSSQITYPISLINTYIEKTIGQLTSIQRLFQNLDTNSNDCPPIDSLILLAHTSSDVIRNAASTTSSIQHFEQITEDCRLLAEAATEFYAKFKDSKNNDDLKAISISEVLAKLQTIAEAMKALPAPINDLDQMESQLTDEIGNMEEAIKRAVEQIEELQKKSRETSTGEKLVVNDKILLTCTDLMNSIRVLVICSNELQDEILKAGKGFSSAREFYKRNHVWTEGLISAARAVGAAAKYLVNSADSLIMGKGKFEQVIVAAQEIGASVAQLFISSRVKADKGSKKLAGLSSASKNVNKNTATLVATVKDVQQSLQSDKLLDFSSLSLHEAKKEEMESQIRTLELESELSRERARLASLRKLHYHLASLVAEENGETKEPEAQSDQR